MDQQTSLLAHRPVLDDPLQSVIYDILCMDSMGIDGLSQKLDHDTMAIVNALALMEIEGIVESSG